MKKTLISKDKFKIMPWKNGGGMTAEIDIHPAGSDFKENQFEWRVSSAHVADENQFSQFPGYDRILTVVSGEGLLLNNQELGPFETFEFEGEEKIECSLIESAVEDLGVIFKRNKYQASFQVLNVTAPMYLKINAGVHFFMTLSNPLTIDGVDLQGPQFLKIENDKEAGIEMSAQIFPAHLLQVTISEK